jgi:hypothetical protein
MDGIDIQRDAQDPDYLAKLSKLGQVTVPKAGMPYSQVSIYCGLYPRTRPTRVLIPSLDRRSWHADTPQPFSCNFLTVIHSH